MVDMVLREVNRISRYRNCFVISCWSRVSLCISLLNIFSSLCCGGWSLEFLRIRFLNLIVFIFIYDVRSLCFCIKFIFDL